jgi:hypothetical protein
MVVDFLRSCYKTSLYLWGPDRPPVPVRWFWASGKAKLYQGPTPFDGVTWLASGRVQEPDEYRGPPGAWDNGQDRVGYAGQHVDGSAAAWEFGGLWGDTPPITTTDFGAPPDCVPTGIRPRGGQAEGGAARQGGGLRVAGSGGQAEGGRARQGGGQRIAGSRGQSEGGHAGQRGGSVLSPLGGESQGGSATQRSGYVWTARGGQAEGSAAASHGGYPVVGRGGQRQGGVSAQSGGSVLLPAGGEGQGGGAASHGGSGQAGTGGQAEGGLSGQHGGYAWVSTRGQVEGGAARQGGGLRVAGSGGQLEGGTATQSGNDTVNTLYHDTGNTTAAYVTVRTITVGNGLHGSWSIKNTAGANTLKWRVMVTDMYGTVTTAADQVLTAGYKASFDFEGPAIQGGAYEGVAPISSITLQVIDALGGSHASYDAYASVIS